MDFYDADIFESLAGPIHGFDVESIQLNLGRLCNLSCHHCHLEASPKRIEIMGRSVMQEVLRVLEKSDITRVELTGGAPELNPYFCEFVTELRELGYIVKVRTNLTAMHEPGLENLPSFLREKEIGLAASLPCYLEKNVSKQRGNDVFDKSIQVLKVLNSLGYGSDGAPELELVYNPGEAVLPGNQADLEIIYRNELFQRYGIVFTRLLVLTNIPVGRFARLLKCQGMARDYMDLLRFSFNMRTLDRLMCRRQLSVDWDGTLYDCDFNLALGKVIGGGPTHISSFSKSDLARRKIQTAAHCLGCTAGAGSSCGGALKADVS
ncbi:MAG: arsenosugar biosynthesis radical SAM protein ArsS [Clostridiales bacterium]|jgi:radical SAM/Cys-rich protein|nr:arsenosugar biosynthesis radical SAM protein ArsS [Clostridiales bacterium]